MLKKLTRAFLLFTALCLALLLSTTVVIAATVLHSGVVMVKVHDKGPDGVNIQAPIPASLVSMAPTIARLAGAEDGLDRARRELEPWRPLLRNVADELAAAPSFTLVEVRDADETVHITKEGDTLVINVTSPDADVHVSFPISLLDSLLTSFS